MRKPFENLFLFCTVAAGFAIFMWVTAWMVRPPLEERALPYTPEQIAAAEKARDVSFELDEQKRPRLQKEMVVEPKNEAPILAELVAEGVLPPLKERMPREPVVIQGVDGIGTYGGAWRRLANQPSDAETINYRMSGASMMRWSPLGKPVVPHIAKSVEPRPDKRVWTITLREGMRWSDGHPYTTDDVLYWWQHEANNKLVLAVPPDWSILNGKPCRIEAIDKHKFTITFDDPCLILREYLVTRDMSDSPAHYLRPLHPDIGDPELCQKLMAAYKQPSRAGLYTFLKRVWNPEHPRHWPWVYRTFRASPPQVFVRNPYYYAVDPEGNQLPYLDRVQFDVQDPKILALTAAGGGASMQDRHIRFSDYTELMSRRQSSGTHIYHWYPASRSVWVINPNQNKRIDPDDPTTALKAELLSNKKFRQALSLAINRKQIIQADYNGVGKPEQVSPGPESGFDHRTMAKSWVDYDPQRAGRMLDELGLTRRDIDGFRTFKDGSTMVWFLDTTSFTGIGPAQFVADDWGAVGIRCIIRDRNRPLFYAEKDSMSFDFNVWTGESDFAPLLSPRYFIALNSESFYAVGWGKWFQRGGLYNTLASQSKGSIPVPQDHPMHEGMVTYDKALMARDEDEQKRLISHMMDIAAENCWAINIATAPPQLVVVKDGFKNVPRNALYGNIYWTPANTAIDTYYWEHPSDSAGAIEETKQAIRQVTPISGAPGNGKASGMSSKFTGTIIRWGFTLIGILLVVLTGLRHPFIMHRLFIMVPTLLIISVAVFIIIQLPPGDFLTTKIIQLQESGDATDTRQINDLKSMFNFDEPGWKQYLRWMGLHWFVTFKANDTGLLQGNLGRSMENQQFVNDLVGDSIMLTVVLSVATIVFTWCTALPIGIYSAVRQYSIADYVLTLLGFVGMCIPGFLLALVLVAAAGLELGLFSADYAVQPEWTWGKVKDLLQHMVVPVVVLGVGGTAGMIRIMRANLLDELKKPYVITAMAKGVRPTKLLLKYPVRLALNPFVSGIGALFPQLVSGGAIVSMVLALPTVGPLQIAALMNQDMYLAGSMLMVLSILGVLGTLVSDMLLLWLDPRIRFEGGTR
jgi:ABC-type dipeptide/oligopeptide/nickel transport system permease component/ABC-type transport system substrate-binding protein